MSAKFIIERIQAGDKDARYIYYLDGISTGLKYAKAKLQRDDRASLFCVHAMLTPEQEFDVLRSFVESHPATADLSLGNALLLALVDAFPCH
jgi:hypothetical protein